MTEFRIVGAFYYVVSVGQNINVYYLFDFGKSENNFQVQLSQFSSGPSSWTPFWSLFHPSPTFSRPNKHSSYNRKPKSAR